MKRDYKKIILVGSLFGLLIFSGCPDMKGSGQKQDTETYPSEHEGDELVALRADNKKLRKENEDLKTVNAGMQADLTNLQKRDEKLSQKISDMKVDLRQQTLLSAGLLEDKKTLETENQELKANLDAWKKQKTLPVGAGK